MSRLTGTLFILCAALVSASAQIPNAGFEQWSGGEPVGWATPNFPSAIPITQGTPARSGSSALKGTVLDLSGNPYGPFALTQFPVSQAYGSVNGYYQFSPVGGDVFVAVVVAAKNGATIGGGVFETGTAASSYTPFSVVIEYTPGMVPDTLVIEFFITDSVDIDVGSMMLVDDLSLGAVVSVAAGEKSLPGGFILHRNYPNPFNPSTMIEFIVPESGLTTLTVFTVLGEEVARLFEGEATAGRTYQVRFDAAHLPAGPYLYRLVSGPHQAAGKVMLVK